MLVASMLGVCTVRFDKLIVARAPFHIGFFALAWDNVYRTVHTVKYNIVAVSLV
jgi:hypothetical protein